MITVNCDMVCPRDEIVRHVQRYSLEIQRINREQDGNNDVRLRGTVENVKLFYSNVMDTGETFEEWLEHSAVITSKVQLTNLLNRAFAYAYAEYENAIDSGDEETMWDDVFGHIQIARDRLSRVTR